MYGGYVAKRELRPAYVFFTTCRFGLDRQTSLSIPAKIIPYCVVTSQSVSDVTFDSSGKASFHSSTGLTVFGDSQLDISGRGSMQFKLDEYRIHV